MYAYYFLGDSHDEALYRRLLQGIEARRPEIPAQGSPQRINRVMLAVMIDHPGLFWFEGSWSPAGPGPIDAIAPHYILSPEQIQQGHEALRQCLEALSPIKGMSPRDRALYLYRWLLERVDYGFGAARGQSLYDALVTGSAVCKGLSKAYQYLAESFGLFCTLSMGTLDGQSAHVWNILGLEDSHCNVDVSMGYDVFSHLYPPPQRNDPLRAFGVSDEHLRATHRILDYGFPRLNCPMDLRR